MNKISEYFKEKEYKVFFGHEMPTGDYKYIEDYDEDVSREFFIALFKLFITTGNDDFDVDNTIEGVDVSFDDEFGYYDDDDVGFEAFVNSLEAEDVRLTEKEKSFLAEYLTNLLGDISACEAEEYDPDYEDSYIEEVIEDQDFVIVIASHSLW